MKRHVPKTLVILVAAACGFAMSTAAQAATVAFEYSDPDGFRDIRATDQSQQRFERSVLREFEEQFREEATALPEGQTLQVTMTDVDLAGDVEYFHRFYPFGLRVIRNIDYPRMKFSYVLRDADGDVIRSGDEALSDMNFQFPTFATRNNLGALDYEKALISDWYDETFRG